MLTGDADTGSVPYWIGNPYQQQYCQWTPKLAPLHEIRHTQPQSSAYSRSPEQLQLPSQAPLSPLSLGLQTPPPTPGHPGQYVSPQTYEGFGQTAYASKNPFRRMTIPSGYGVSGLSNQMDKMHMNPQPFYPSPPPTAHRDSAEGGHQYFRG